MSDWIKYEKNDWVKFQHKHVQIQVKTHRGKVIDYGGDDGKIHVDKKGGEIDMGEVMFWRIKPDFTEYKSLQKHHAVLQRAFEASEWFADYFAELRNSIDYVSNLSDEEKKDLKKAAKVFRKLTGEAIENVQKESKKFLNPDNR